MRGARPGGAGGQGGLEARGGGWVCVSGGLRGLRASWGSGGWGAALSTYMNVNLDSADRTATPPHTFCMPAHPYLTSLLAHI